uniref:Uncharacterized protein n=1 Tax=Mola mola TaxID=94237 RepID=A0A3Q3XAV6_MOLML
MRLGYIKMKLASEREYPDLSKPNNHMAKVLTTDTYITCMMSFRLGLIIQVKTQAGIICEDRRGNLQTSISHWTRFSARPSPWTQKSRKLSCCS